MFLSLIFIVHLYRSRLIQTHSNQSHSLILFSCAVFCCQNEWSCVMSTVRIRTVEYFLNVFVDDSQNSNSLRSEHVTSILCSYNVLCAVTTTMLSKSISFVGPSFLCCFFRKLYKLNEIHQKFNDIIAHCIMFVQLLKKTRIYCIYFNFYLLFRTHNAGFVATISPHSYTSVFIVGRQSRKCWARLLLAFNVQLRYF